jgi:hypothetical protein
MEDETERTMCFLEFLECGSPLLLWYHMMHVEKRQAAAALQDAGVFVESSPCWQRCCASPGLVMLK